MSGQVRLEIGEYVRTEWATMLEKNEEACVTRMGEYLRIEWATMLDKNEGVCTSGNRRVCTNRMNNYAC